MDHSPYIEQQLDNAQRDAAKQHAEVKRLEALLDEATRLLFVQGDKPSRELFGWWFRRDHERKQRKSMFAPNVTLKPTKSWSEQGAA